MQRVLGLLLIATVSFAACDRSQPATPVVERPTAPSASSSAPDGGGCPNQSEVVASDESQEGSTQRVDVDGDARREDVRLHLDFEAPVGCQAFLSVATGQDPVVEPVWVLGAEGGLPQPSLYSFANLDGLPGYEIVVNEASGASTQFVAAYGYRDGAIVPITVPDNENGLFAFGGSVGHIEAVDCGPDGDIVISQAVPAAGKAAMSRNEYQISRTIYTFAGGDLEKETTERHEVPLEELERFAEFRLGPFGSCAGP